MRHFYNIAALLTVLSITLFTTSCKKDNPDNTLDAQVSISINNTTAYNITIDVAFTNATESFLHISKSAEGTLSAEDVISSGTSVESTITSYTFEQLEENTQYTIYAVAKNDKNTAFQSVQATTADDDFDGYSLPRVIEAQYRTDNTAGAGNYELVLGNTSELEWEGDIKLMLDLYNVADEDPINAVLPNGTYEPNTDMSPFTYNPSYSYVEILTEGGEIVSSPIVGIVEVSRQGAEYTIIVDGVLYLNEEPFKAKYQGQIQFVETGTAAYQPFQDDQDITFTYGQMRYWGNWYRPMADDCAIELFDAEFDEEGTLVSGYHLTLLNVYMTKNPDYNNPNIPIVEGTYTILPNRNQPYSYSQPYRFEPGTIEDLYGELSFVGSRLTYVDPTTNTKLASAITGGTFHVELSSDTYVITVDLTTAEGVSITGEYQGEIVVGNFNDNDLAMPQRPWSTMTEDHTYNFPEETQCYMYLFGNQVDEEHDSWFIMIYGANDQYPSGYGDMFTTELLLHEDNGTETPQGTFNIEWKTQEYTMYPGFIDYANSVLFTYYGDLTPDHEGYSTHSAPISSGQVTISNVGDENYHFVFDMVDDKGNVITGEWTGPVIKEDLRGEIDQMNLIRKNATEIRNIRK